jgi:hypothetical protein
MKILTTLNISDITYNNITYNLNKCHLTYLFFTYCYKYSHVEVKSVK